jgi:GTPase SAR1 family protein
MSDFGDGREVEDLPVFQGKVIILGDGGTGKSSLLNSLKPISQPTERGQANAVFSVVELSPYEIKYDGKVLLKVWEYSGRLEYASFILY